MSDITVTPLFIKDFLQWLKEKNINDNTNCGWTCWMLLKFCSKLGAKCHRTGYIEIDDSPRNFNDAYFGFPFGTKFLIMTIAFSQLDHTITLWMDVESESCFLLQSYMNYYPFSWSLVSQSWKEYEMVLTDFHMLAFSNKRNIRKELHHKYFSLPLSVVKKRTQQNFIEYHTYTI